MLLDGESQRRAREVSQCYNSVMALLWLPGAGEWILILLAVLILFGANKVPQFMRGLGEGVREFKKAVSNDDETKKPDAVPETEKKEEKV